MPQCSIAFLVDQICVEELRISIWDFPNNRLGSTSHISQPASLRGYGGGGSRGWKETVTFRRIPSLGLSMTHRPLCMQMFRRISDWNNITYGRVLGDINRRIFMLLVGVVDFYGNIHFNSLHVIHKLPRA